VVIGPTDFSDGAGTGRVIPAGKGVACRFTGGTAGSYPARCTVSCAGDVLDVDVVVVVLEDPS
jgi:hypothetical protein